MSAVKTLIAVGKIENTLLSGLKLGILKIVVALIVSLSFIACSLDA
jgi:hypothetical protein